MNYQDLRATNAQTYRQQYPLRVLGIPIPGTTSWGPLSGCLAQMRGAHAADEQSLFEQLRVARLNLRSAEETLRLTRHRKELGVGVVLEDIQAQQELLKARTDYVGIVSQLNQEQYGLMRSVGAPLRNP